MPARLLHLLRRLLEPLRGPQPVGTAASEDNDGEIDDHSSSDPAAIPQKPEEWSPPEGVPIPIEDTIDLHTFSPRETGSVVDEYLREAHQRGFGEVRIIHGKGTGVQRRIVRSMLEKHPLVVSFDDAPPSRGGWGATLVWLAPHLTDDDM